MNTEFLKQKSQLLIDAKKEYLKLGLQLKELTRVKIAEKFLIQSNAITAISQLDIEDLVLIGKLITERQKMVGRREYLRKKYAMY